MNNYKVIVAALFLGAGVYLGWPAPPQTGAVSAVAESSTAEQVRHSASGTAASATSNRALVNSSAGSNERSEVFRSFDNWMEKLDATPVSTEFIDEGLRLAQARKASMQALIRSNPEQALANALSLKEYAALPEVIQAHVEKPFSERTNLMVLADDSGLMSPNKPRFDPNQRTAGEKVQLAFQDHEQVDLVRYGSRAQLLSKDSIATQGVVLNGVAAIHPAALQVVPMEDVGYIKKTFPARTTDTQHDFFTGEAIQGEPVVALAGGQVFYFASSANVERLNLQLTELEKRADPKLGSQLLFAGAQPGSDGATASNTPLATQISQILAGPALSWSATNKSVYFIRVTFSDKPLNARVTQSKLSSDLQKVSDNIWEMSQGKSRLSYTVNDDSHTVLMPHDSIYYYDKPNGVEKNSEAASDAITALQNIDSSFNPNNYDMIGLFFPDLWDGAPGWAGGSRLWIFDYDNEYLLTHEFGHCYGLGHAHFWKTTDGSSVGTGTTDEYGDSFDFMGDTYDNRDDYHMQARHLLGWFDATDWQDITASGSYRLQRFDHFNADGVRGLRVSRGTGGGYYWLGHRQKFDDNKYLENGLYLIWQKNGFERSWLVDTTPGSADSTTSADRKDGAILVGHTYSDRTVNPGIHITATAKGGTEPNEWVDVQVNIGNFSGNNPPVLTGINGAALVAARQGVTFSAVVNDPDGDALAYSWDFGDGVINPSVASISHQWAVGGTYTVKLTVSDMKGGTASTQMIVTVEDPLNVWTQRTSNANKDLHDIATDGNKVVAVSGSQMKYVVYSTDGIIWSKSPEFDLGVHMRGIAYANGLWVAVGQDWLGATGNWPGAIFTSTDGVTWTRRYQANIGVTALYKVAYGNGTWVAVGESGMIVTSTDGLTWSQQTSGTTETITDIAYGNNQFAAVAAGNPLVLLTSTDAQTWVDRSSVSGVSNGNEFSRIDYVHDRFIASGWYEGISYSTSGINFENNQPTGQFTPSNAYGNGLFFSAGINRSNSGADINLVSTDGMNWTLLSTASQSNRNAVVFFKDTFITVGDGGSIYQSASLSTDTVPLPFTFVAKTDVALSATVVSEPVLISGIDAATSWNVTNGETCVSSTNSCSCDVGGFAASGTVTDGRYMCVRHTASGSYASNVSSTLTVGGISGSFGSTTVKNDQTIIFGSLGNKVLGDADFGISATASSGLVVTLSSQTSSICTVATSRVHLIAAGTCTIRASQAGNGSYNPAPNVEQSFSITPTPVNGICGNDHGKTLSLTPTALCSTGVASAVTTTTSRYDWGCSGSNGGNSSTCSATRQISSNDIDGDGVSDANDGEPNDARVATPIDQQSNTVRLETNYAFQNVAIVPESTLPETGKPDPTSFDFPKGAIEYTVTGIPSGGQITVTITFADVIPSGSKVYKISSAGYQLFSAPNAIINGNTVTLTLTDGGLGDDDGRINGVIVDPVAIAEPVNNTATGSTGGGGGGSMPLEWLLFVFIAYLLRYREQIKYT